jgi:CheY-like chemotaxis protein
MSPLLPTRHILLADDDKDDQLLFKEALEEIPLSTNLTIVQNGEQLMQSLNDKRKELPDVLFLDLNMPRKNGFTCLSEIKQSERLKQFPVIIYTTSYEPEIVNLLYKNEAQYYIRKPNNFEHLKKAVNKALTLTEQKNNPQPSRENFVLSH